MKQLAPLRKFNKIMKYPVKRKIFKKKVRKADGAYYTKANGKYVEKQAATMTGLDRKIKKFLEDEEKKIIFGLETQRDLQAMEDMTEGEKLYQEKLQETETVENDTE